MNLTRRPYFLLAFLLCTGFAWGCGRPGADSAPASSAPSAASAEPAAKVVSPSTSVSEERAPASPGNAVYDETAQQITSKPGSHFSVLLPASIGTPMKWRIEPAPDPAILSVLAESYSEAPPSDCPGCTGYGGTRRFDFAAKSAGKLTLDFAYRSLTAAKGPAEKQVHLVVTVVP